MPSIQTNLSADPESELHAIQRLQFNNIDQANQRLAAHFQESVPFGIAEAKIIPRAVSLNSISGSLLTKDGTKYFFKTHVEPDSILREYYNVELLETAGYPVVRPVYASHEPGRQIVVYPYLGSPTMFDVVRGAEGDTLASNELVQVQEESDRLLSSIYERTLMEPGSCRSEVSPIHQLFYHRLSGPRFRDFYVGKSLNLNGIDLTFAELAKFKWCINGVEYRQTLAQLIEFANTALLPGSDWGPTIIGHGDAHNGNLFYEKSPARLVYFDPAFAGRHSPLLDLAKPLFHNVFASWMYFPEEVNQELSVSCRLEGDRMEVAHNYSFSAFRQETLRSKLAHVLVPLLRGPYGHLFHQSNWLRLLKAALFCCPLLTVNLADSKRFPGGVALLGFSQCIEVGAETSSGLSFFESVLQSVLGS